MKNFWWMLCALGVGLLAFHMRVRISLADPTDLSWMQHHDWAHHVQGWNFYRWDAWHMPLGYFSNLLYPVGASTGLTDSIPWLALIFKVFNFVLPKDFQYFGLYLLFCFVMQAMISYKLIKELTRDDLYSLIGCVFFALAPVLLYRIVHIALCSQWIMLAGILWYRRSARDRSQLKGSLIKITLLNSLAAATHPYIWVMSFCVSLSLFCLVLWKVVFTWRRFILFVSGLLIQPLLALAIWWLCGYFMFESPAGGGFDYYRSDLTVFFNPMGEKALLPRISAGPGQYEGYAYLGAGLVLLLFLHITYALSRVVKLTKEKSLEKTFMCKLWWIRYDFYFPLALVAILLWIFALSSTPSFAGYVLADLNFLYSKLAPIPNSFRSSGRFSWLLYYCVMLFLIVALYRKTSRLKAVILLSSLLVLQIYDLKRYYSNIPRRYPLLKVGSDPFWESAGLRYRHLVIWPQGSGGPCDGEKVFTQEQYRAFIFYAASQHMSVNIGAVSRFPEGAVKSLCNKTHTEIGNGEGQPETLYLIGAEEFKGVDFLKFKNFSCQIYDSFKLCANR